MFCIARAGQDEYADSNDPLPEGLIGNLKEFHVSYSEVRNRSCYFLWGGGGKSGVVFPSSP